MKSNRVSTGDAKAIQRIVLADPDRDLAQHLLVRFPHGSHPQTFLSWLMYGKAKEGNQDAIPATPPASAADADDRARHPLLLSVGLTFHGLRRLDIPEYVLSVFRAKAPAFAAGAPVRSAQHLGDTGHSASPRWNPSLSLHSAHAVITLHADKRCDLLAAVERIQNIAHLTEKIDGAANPAGQGTRVEIDVGLPIGKRLIVGGDRFVHFGYRDGLSRIGVKGSEDEDTMMSSAIGTLKKISRHRAGEFVLGHAQDSGANPWILRAKSQLLPAEMRKFFRNGSFGVLRQIEQDVDAFEAFVVNVAQALCTDCRFDAAADPLFVCGASSEPLPAYRRVRNLCRYVKAKLCGRWPDGSRFDPKAGATPSSAQPAADFDYRDDKQGIGCPFGAHVRRMNPRGTPIAQTQPRPLIRRGIPYGPAYIPTEDLEGPPEIAERGLLGLFFCASIEDQFEHLLGQWADRVPLGSPDEGRAKDPLIGLHEDATGVFDIPLVGNQKFSFGMNKPFVTTRGTAYLFYPSLDTLKGITESRLWVDTKEYSAYFAPGI